MTKLIWEPLNVGPITFKNRVGMAPHSQAYGRDNVPTDRHVSYYRERAKGGAGFLASEYTEASRLTTGPYPSMLTAYDARAIPYWRTLADAVHEHDCRWIVELFSPGV